jgi:glycosyltransferase involved in cell wall biosynthesis
MENQVPMDVEFDLVLSQNKFGMFQILHQFARENHLPLVSLEHTLPVPSWTQADLNGLRQMRGDVNVFISEFSRKEWGWDEKDAEVVHHGVDTQLFSPAEQLVDKKPTVLSVVNDWINRDWCCGFKLWQSVVQNDIPVTVVGDTPGLSKPAASTHELVMRYREAQVFINTSLISPVPTALLEAMSCGTPVVSTATAMIPEVIQHGVNGFISNDAAELREYTQMLMSDASLRKRIGDAARETILKRFSMEKFVENWNGVFERAANIPFKG